MKLKKRILFTMIFVFFCGCDNETNYTQTKELIVDCSLGTTTVMSGDVIENPDGAVIKILLSSLDTKEICIDNNVSAYLIRGI